MISVVLVNQKKIEFFSYAITVCFCAVGAKANVLQSVGFVRWIAALLILPKRWHFFPSYFCLLNVCTVFQGLPITYSHKTKTSPYPQPVVVYVQLYVTLFYISIHSLTPQIYKRFPNKLIIHRLFYHFSPIFLKLHSI